MITPKQITFSKSPEWVGVEYGSINPFSSKGEILLIKRDHFGLYDETGKFIKDLNIGASNEPRWGKKDEIYFVRGNGLYTYQDSFKTTLIAQFSEYIEYTSDGGNGIRGLGESDISEDLDHFVLFGQTKQLTFEIFIYEISTKKKILISTDTLVLDGLKITPNNKVIASTPSGLFVLNPLNKRVQLTSSNGHAAVGRDTDGSDIVVWTNNNDNAIYKIKVDTGERTKLLDLDWSLAVDISLCSKKFALISTYGKNATGNYANAIIKVALDGSPAEVLCSTFSKTPTNDFYNAQPKASVSRDGSRFVFSSNSGKVDSPNYCDVYLGLLEKTPSPTASLPSEIDLTKYRKVKDYILQVKNGAIEVYVPI